MERLVHIDTHVAVFLYSGQLELFSKKILDSFENNELYISEIVRLELKYLFEIGRINTGPGEIIEGLTDEIGLKISGNTYQRIIDKAIELNFTRDPFDRIIVADAMIQDSVLVSKDRHIKKNYKNTIW